VLNAMCNDNFDGRRQDEEFLAKIPRIHILQLAWVSGNLGVLAEDFKADVSCN
jgi:hypothetical protein